MEQLKEAQKTNEQLKSKLKQYQEMDPDVLNQLKKDSEVILVLFYTFLCLVYLIQLQIYLFRAPLPQPIGGLTTFSPSNLGARTSSTWKKAI